jgi:predicted transcriptional regulator
MKKITVRLDEPVHTFLARIAAERQVSLSQLINETLARFVVAEKGSEMMEARAARARPGAMQQVLDRTAAHGLAPLHPEDALPSDVDRRLLERRVHEARSLHEEGQGDQQAGRRDDAQPHSA